jgi:hypothetical protein
VTYQRHWLLSWGGKLSGGDIWANNVRMMNRETGSFDSITDGNMEDLLTGFLADVRAFHTATAAKISNAASVEWIKFNEIGPDGRYANQTKTFARFLPVAGPPTGQFFGAGGANCPPFQSVCITTTTDVMRGPGSKGRLFLPQCGPTLSTQGLIAQADQTALANLAGTFFTNLGNEDGIDNTAIAPAVVSNVGEPGPMNRITGVRVGNVPDVITRRKNAIVETYVSASVSTA